MQIWILTGYDTEVGLWEPEVFTSREEAENAFYYYVGETAAHIEGSDEFWAHWHKGTFRLTTERI